jgi:hypothetical protein
MVRKAIDADVMGEQPALEQRRITGEADAR